jgi:hypothetical protein
VAKLTLKARLQMSVAAALMYDVLQKKPTLTLAQALKRVNAQISSKEAEKLLAGSKDIKGEKL